MNSRMEVSDTMTGKAAGMLYVVVHDRADRQVDYREFQFVNPHPNTVVKGAYQEMILLATGLGTAVSFFGLGDEPAPTGWEWTISDGNILWWSTAGQLTATQNIANLSMSFTCEVGYNQANGTGVETYYEAMLVSAVPPATRIFSRVAFRDPAGAIAGLTKHDEYRITFNWTIFWGVSP